jgi:RNA polymerase sigma-70 factor, ECF subfamily
MNHQLGRATAQRQSAAASHHTRFTCTTLEQLDGGKPAASADELAARFIVDVAPLENKLRRAAWRYAKQSADAEDLLQETLMRAWRAYASFESDTNLYAWLHRIMVNAWINQYRTAQRRPTECLVAGHGDESSRHSEISADGRIFDGMPAPEVLQAMQSLPESQRLVVYYAFVEGRRHKEISALMGIPVGTVMSRLHRARNNLRVALGDFAIERGYGSAEIDCGAA